MSDLLNQASLVMVPSGYKEDVVYSQIPTDGSGDMAFTRASNGTRTNSAGLVEVCPWNLCTYSEDLSNAAWSKVNGTITANDTTAPNGTTTADKFAPSSTLTGGFFYLSQVVISGATSQAHTATMYAKAGGLTQMLMYLGSSAGIYWNLSNGQFIGYYSGAQTITNYSSEAVGDGWYKYTISISSLSGSVTMESYGAKGGTIVANFTTSDSYYLWGAQLNIGATAKPYFPTTDRLNVPRLTYQNGGGGCPSLLLEKQSTNYLIYNTEIDNAAWVKARSTVTANATTSLDGTQNADGVFVNSDTNTNHEIFQYGGGGTEGWSAFFKANGYNYVYMFGSADPVVWFDLQNGVVGTAQSGVYGKITNYGNGWYRCEYYKNSGTNSIWGFGIVASDATTTIASPDTSKGVYFWGAQAEAGLYSTSMIYTTSSSATRVADACYKTGISSLIGQTEGTILIDWVQNAFHNSQGIYANNYNLTGSISIQIATNGTLSVFVCYAGTYFSISTSANAIQIGQRYKVGFAYKSGDLALYINGNLIGTDTTSFAFTTTLDEIDLSNRTVFFANLSEISVNELVQIKTRISNSDIQSWTA